MNGPYVLLERIGALLEAEVRAADAGGLQPVHLRILRYLAACNRYSDSPTAVAEYLRVTKGTASQSIARLEERGFVRKRRDAGDGRRLRLALTAAGRRVLEASAPGAPFQEALDALPDEERERLASSLEKLLRALQAAHGGRSFGACHTCRFHLRELPGRFRCGLTGEPLAPEETRQICREHEPAAA